VGRTKGCLCRCTPHTRVTPTSSSHVKLAPAPAHVSRGMYGLVSTMPRAAVAPHHDTNRLPPHIKQSGVGRGPQRLLSLHFHRAIGITPPPPHPSQVMENVVPAMRRAQSGVDQVLRARFSAISAPEVQAAMVRHLCVLGAGGRGAAQTAVAATAQGGWRPTGTGACAQSCFTGHTSMWQNRSGLRW
jgi:hypothetical protein